MQHAILKFLLPGYEIRADDYHILEFQKTKVKTKKKDLSFNIPVKLGHEESYARLFYKIYLAFMVKTKKIDSFLRKKKIMCALNFFKSLFPLQAWMEYALVVVLIFLLRLALKRRKK